MAKSRVSRQVSQQPFSKLNMSQSHFKKRKGTKNEGNSSELNSSMFPAKKTHHITVNEILDEPPKNPRTYHMVEVQGGNIHGMAMDRFKKMQCNVVLKRLMIHKDGWAFGGEGKNLEIHDTLSKPLMYLATIKWKLERGFYINTDHFSTDVRIMFSNAMLHYPVKHVIHRIAVRLSDIFEEKWKFLENKWGIKEERRGEEKEKTKPSKRDREVSAASSTDLQRKKERETARLKLQKTTRTVYINDNMKFFEELEKLCGHSLSDFKTIKPLRDFFGLILKE